MDSNNISKQNDTKNKPMELYVIVLLTIYYILIGIALTYFLYKIWPECIQDASNQGGTKDTFNNICLGLRLILVVLLSGGLGSFVQGSASLIRHAEEGELFEKQTLGYILRPFNGCALALIFYFSIRGGLLSISGDEKSINFYGVAAIAGFVGMFSRYAVVKLREVFLNLFAIKEKGEKEEILKGSDKQGVSSPRERREEQPNRLITPKE